ncbi:LysR family transcriptional regulator [Polynucleobacter antarcticus]|uniref:LysR family transcriptional regulator n=1 Tax=Polynucleobacter antarcticus TaxID=1743162 RepID=A0A6M9Q2E8_9BURK|nr:LysR family transcriptional regulator [Polynucleobacter antarcticus]QKM62473.1 LysR family transcriptional regulator [Polynucleobacter antarcticus]
MSIRALRAFLAFNQLGTVAAAAKSVHQSSAAVSVQLKLLEERLGGSLFHRTQRSLSLTSLGYRLLPVAEQILTLHSEMLALSQPSKPAGKLTIGVINSALIGVLPPILQNLKIESPDLDIRIMAGISPTLFTQVQDGILDAAIITRPPKSITTDLMIRPLYTEPFALVMAKTMPYTQLAKILEAQPYIAFDRSTWVGGKAEQFIQKLGIKTHVVMELDSQEAIISLIKHGIGVSVLPIQPGSEVSNDKTLQFISLSGLHRDVVFVEKKDHPHAHLTSKLMDAYVNWSES